jgi:hypothetical protein
MAKNKGERQFIKKLKFHKRLKVLDLYKLLGKPGTNLNSFRTTGKPCSCYICSSRKFKRPIKHKNLMYEL